MPKATLKLRMILALVAFLAVALIVLTYLGDSLSVNGLAACLAEGQGAGGRSPEERQAYLEANFRRMYDIWGYVRFAGLGMLILAILGFVQSGRTK